MESPLVGNITKSVTQPRNNTPDGGVAFGGSQNKEAISRRHQTVRAAFVTNICTHYRVKTFERLAELCDVEFFFYSAGNEWYWQQNHGVRAGNFRHSYLHGLQLTQCVRLVPSLVTKLWRRNYDVYIKCINGRFALPATYLIARLRRKPFILWTGIWMSLDTPFHRLIFPLTRWIYRHADATVVYGKHVKRYLESVKVPAEKIFVAPHAVDNSQYDRVACDEEKFVLRTKLKLGNAKIVLYLGRLEAIKGLDYLIRCFALLKHHDAVLVIAGDGSLRQELEALAQHFGVQRPHSVCRLCSAGKGTSLLCHCRRPRFTVVTMPTGKETWGLVVNEAMNQGLPVIATEAVGAAAGGLVQSGVNGFIVPERDSRALAAAIERILNDDGLRAEMSHNARRIIAGWDNERMVQGFQEAIAYALNKRQRYIRCSNISSTY